MNKTPKRNASSRKSSSQKDPTIDNRKRYRRLISSIELRTIAVYWVLLGFTEFQRVLLGFTGFYWLLLGFTEFQSDLLGSIGCN